MVPCIVYADPSLTTGSYRAIETDASVYSSQWHLCDSSYVIQGTMYALQASWPSVSARRRLHRLELDALRRVESCLDFCTRALEHLLNARLRLRANRAK